MRCKAKSKRSGERCKKDAVPGTEVCHIHGGKSPKGIDHPRFKNGSKSRYVPRGNLVERYNEAFDAGVYTEQREEIALTTGMINEVLSKREESAGTVFRELQKDWNGFEHSRLANDVPKMRAHLDNMGQLIHRGVTAGMQRDEAVKLMDHRRKLVDSETRRLEREKQMMTLEQVMIRDAILLEVLREMLTPEQLHSIRQRLEDRLG